MNTNPPVGENRPPWSTAPENRQTPAQSAVNNAATDAGPAREGDDAQSGETAIPPFIPAGSPYHLKHGQLLPAGAAPAGPAGAAAPQPGAFGAGAPAPQGAPPVPGYTVPLIPVKERQPFSATRADGWFAITCFVLGFLLVRWVAGLLAGGALLAGMEGWGVTAWCGLYAAGVLAYARAKKVKPKGASWFWLAVLLGCAAAYALWPAGLLTPWRSLLTLGAAVYWCGSLFGLPLAGKTSNLLGLDAINLLFVVPTQNLGCTLPSLKALPGGEGSRQFWLRRVLPVVAGAALCVPLLAVVLPLLISADSAGFGQLMEQLSTTLQNLWLWRVLQQDAGIITVQLLFGVPVGLNLFGFVGGAAHQRYTRQLDAKKTTQLVHAARRAPAVTIMMVLAVACLTYLVFIGCQLPYFFAAFAGQKPAGFAVYSEYAREGFFELCRIAAINMGLLVAANLLCKQASPGGRDTGLRFFNLLLSALTLLVMATAFSKMGLYILRHGFTPKRIMTCVFMLFLAGIYLAIMVLQFKKFSIVRFGAVLGAGLLCLLCLCNLDGQVVRYNAGAWQAGRLEDFDELIVARSGPAAAPQAMAVYRQLQDSGRGYQTLRLEWALYHIREEARATEGTSRDSAANRTARAIIKLPVTDAPPQNLGAEALAEWEAMSPLARENWEYEQMEKARTAFENYYAAQLERGGYE